MGIAPLNVPCKPSTLLAPPSYETDNATDRDVALALGWVHTLLTTAILQLPEEMVTMPVKIDAVAAVNKVSARACPYFCVLLGLTPLPEGHLDTKRSLLPSLH